MKPIDMLSQLIACNSISSVNPGIDQSNLSIIKTLATWLDDLGFGPGEEETAHTVNDSVLLEDVVKATEFYALLPGVIE